MEPYRPPPDAMHVDVRFWPVAEIADCTAHVRFRGQADILLCESPHLRSLLGVKQTSLIAAHMSADGPKQTWVRALLSAFGVKADTVSRAKKPKVQIKRTKTSLGLAYRIYIDGMYMGTGLTKEISA